MLKIATQHADILSSSPKSPSSLLADLHIKAPAGGKAATTGGPMKHMRRSHSGKHVRVKKGNWMQYSYLFLVTFLAEKLYLLVY